MAITDRTSLLNAISTSAGWLARDDLTTPDDDFVTLAEARIAYGAGPPYPSPALRVRAMEQSTDLGISSQTTALPTSFLGARRLYIDTDPVQALDFLAPNDFWRKYMSTTTGEPKAFTLEGDNIVVGPTPDATYTGKLTYWKKFDALSASTTTNWLLTNYPSIYLYGTLLEAAIYIQDAEKAQQYGSLFIAAINGLCYANETDRFSGAPLQVRTDISGD
jgi:hypothetical protein